MPGKASVMTKPTTAELQEWLEQDEAASRTHRAKRLATMLAILPDEGMIFFGGMSSAQTYTELRLAYIHGLYIATVLLALACIEQDLAGRLHMTGMDSAAKARLETLLKEGLAKGTITAEEFGTFDHLREVRNSYTHFRTPSHPKGWERRAMTTDTPLDDILEADATEALSALGSYLERSSTIT
jgi:uncharacterized membrane protein